MHLLLVNHCFPQTQMNEFVPERAKYDITFKESHRGALKFEIKTDTLVLQPLAFQNL